MKKLSQKKEEMYEISLFFIFITAILTIIAYKSFGSFISFVTLGSMLISHYIFTATKTTLCKSEKLYEINTYKYTEYRKNAC